MQKSYDVPILLIIWYNVTIKKYIVDKMKKKQQSIKNFFPLSHKSFAKGFTLLELIVVIAIITIMTILMLVMMFEDRENRELTAAARGVTAALRDAQNNALSGLSRGDDLPCSFFVKFNGNNNYELGGILREPDGECNVPLDIASYNIDYDVRKVAAGGANGDNHLNEISFAVPHGTMDVVTNDPTLPGPKKIEGAKKIKLMKSSDKAFFICVYPSGQIVEEGIYIVEEGIYKPPHTCGDR